MKLKKVIAVIVVLAVTVGAVTGGIYGYKSYQKKNLVAEVQSVSSLNYGYYGNSETSYGVVTNDSSQEVYLDDSNKVQEVYVSKGDTVKELKGLLKKKKILQSTKEFQNLKNLIMMETIYLNA